MLGVECRVNSWVAKNLRSLQCECKGKRPNGTIVSIMVEAVQKEGETDFQWFDRFFSETHVLTLKAI